jgi:hypothetical protein
MEKRDERKLCRYIYVIIRKERDGIIIYNSNNDQKKNKNNKTILYK